jgi:hypothetical protein
MGKTEFELLGVCFALVLLGSGFFLYRRRFIPWKIRCKLERLRREEEAGQPPHARDYHFAISFDANGIILTNLRSRKAQPTTMRWQEVRRATVFKRDVFTYDCICLLLSRSDKTGIELDEEMYGWNRLTRSLPQFLPGCQPWDQWFSTVAFPAFAPNQTEIYHHADQKTH